MSGGNFARRFRRSSVPRLAAFLAGGLAIIGAVACGGGGGDGGAAPDTANPFVTSTDPANSAIDVPVGGVIAVTFSEAVDPATLTTTTMSIRSGFNTRAGTISSSGATATFTPNAPMEMGAMYTVHVSPGVKDLAGNALPVDYFWTFTTAPPPDTTAPAVVSTSPAAGAVSVPLASAVTARFSEPVDPATVSSATFLVGPEGGAPISGGAVSYDADSVTATFTLPAGETLVHNQRYTATIATNVVDRAGNHLVADHMWTFTAEPFPDLTPPEIVDTSPAPDDKRVPLGAVVKVRFNEAMATASLNNSTFSVTPTGGSPLSGVIAYDGTTFSATFTPSVPLVSGTTYTARLTTGVTDAATTPNPLVAEHQWSFTIIAPRFAFVANSNSDDVTIFGIDPATGLLTLAGTVAAGDGPSSLSVDPTGRFVYVANQNANMVTAFRFDATAATLETVGGGAFTGSAPSSITVDPTGQFVYTTNMNSGNVSAFSIGPTGALVNVAPIPAATTPMGVTVDPSGRFAYVAIQSAGVLRFLVDQQTGTLRDAQSVGAGRQPVSVAVDPSGRFAYVANRFSGDVTSFRIDEDSGLLTEIGTEVRAGSSAAAVAVDPSGRFVYVANRASNNVSAFRIDQSTGALTSIAPAAAAGNQPTSVAVDPSGQYVYVTNFDSDEVTVFTINQTASLTVPAGALTQPATMAAGDGPTSVAIIGSSN